MTALVQRGGLQTKKDAEREADYKQTLGGVSETDPLSVHTGPWGDTVDVFMIPLSAKVPDDFLCDLGDEPPFVPEMPATCSFVRVTGEHDQKALIVGSGPGEDEYTVQVFAEKKELGCLQLPECVAAYNKVCTAPIVPIMCIWNDIFNVDSGEPDHYPDPTKWNILFNPVGEIKVIDERVCFKGHCFFVITMWSKGVFANEDDFDVRVEFENFCDPGPDPGMTEAFKHGCWRFLNFGLYTTGGVPCSHAQEALLEAMPSDDCVGDETNSYRFNGWGLRDSWRTKFSLRLKKEGTVWSGYYKDDDNSLDWALIKELDLPGVTITGKTIGISAHGQAALIRYFHGVYIDNFKFTLGCLGGEP